MNVKIKNYVLIFLGTILMAVATNMVFEPMNMVTGGISGIGIVIKNATAHWIPGGVSLWITNALLNVPLFIMAGMVKGKKFIMQTLFATVCFTVALSIVPSFPIIRDDYLLAAVFGGTVMGAGLGLVLMAGTSTGGTDLLGIIIQSFLRHYSVAQILFAIDSCIVLVGAMVFGMTSALYAVITIFITSKVMETILEGIKYGKLAFIISDQYLQIADEILHVMNRGATSISITGMYSNDDKKMLLCVVSPKEIVEIMDITQKNDPSAFLIVTDVREVMGEGFIEYRQ